MNVITKKIKDEFYAKVLTGNKSFELRKEDDCEYNTGDILILKEINEFNEYTGRLAICDITFVLRDYEGLEEGYVAFSIQVRKTFQIEEESLW